MPFVSGPIHKRFGPILPVEVAACSRRLSGPPLDRAKPHGSVMALLDTGMAMAVVNRQFAEALDLEPFDTMTFGGASFFGGMRELEMVCLRIALPGETSRTWEFFAGLVDGVGDDAPHEICLGQEFLKHFQFSQNGPRQTFELRW